MRLGTYYRYLVCKKLNLPLSADKVLDIGCYDGFLLSCLDAQLKVGIDITTVENFANIEYIDDDFLRHDFAPRKFDRILALDVLEHIKEDASFIKKVMTLLYPQGIAILSTPSKNIQIFPPFLQSWIDRRWQHIYRRGYSLQELSLLVENKSQPRVVNVIQWNCPFFRFFYLPLSLLWRISLPVTKKLLNSIVKLDSRFRQGDNGFYYILIEVKL